MATKITTAQQAFQCMINDVDVFYSYDRVTKYEIYSIYEGGTKFTVRNRDTDKSKDAGLISRGHFSIKS